MAGPFSVFSSPAVIHCVGLQSLYKRHGEMSVPAQVALCSAIIIIGALAGAAVPLFGGKRGRSITFLAFAAGIMLGAAFFQMLPEAMHGGDFSPLMLVPIGFVVLFLLERYVLVHACEEPPDCQEHAHGRSALGLTAFLGMSAHTLFDGVALASSVAEGVAIPALVAITAHKIPSSLSLSSILQNDGRSKPNTLLYIFIFALMVPLGAAVYFGLNAFLHFETLSRKALAFSAGTFMYIAVSDLLPHVNRHGKDSRLQHIAALSFGLLLMFGVGQLLPHHH